MRAAFVQTLVELAQTDERIFLLVGDLGYSLVEPFAQKYPGRFINTGIAEQNMIGIATGLALSGKVVFVYSLANFPTLRCLEQIRNDVCYHHASVKITAGGGGLIYGALGMTHHTTEDLAVMRALPGMTVIAPGDPVESKLATRAVAAQPGPAYIRLGRTGDPVIHKQAPDFKIGKAIIMQEGTDITLVATGGMLVNAVQAAEQLSQQGIGVHLLSMPTIKPLDAEALLAAAEKTGAIITVEEHSIIGGLGSAVAEVLAEQGPWPLAFKRMGINDTFCTQVGNRDYLQKCYNLSAESIVRESLDLLGKKKR